MPSFTVQLANMVVSGPTADVHISVGPALAQYLSKQGLAIPPAVPAVALIDTGASRTVITASIVQTLGIKPVGMAKMSTPSTSTPVPVQEYSIRVAFPNGTIVDVQKAIQAPMGGQSIQCLIGRDVLQHGILTYIGYINQYSLSF